MIDRENVFQGVLNITDLLTQPVETLVSEVMDREVVEILHSTPDREVAILFTNRDLISAPVVDENNHLLGRITIDDVVDVMREDADESFLGMAGVHKDEETFSPVLRTARRRNIWLGVNLITAFSASFVIGLFDKALEELVALAILMPIVASMGGIAGSQTQTLIIRGLAQGRLTASNAQRFINKEIILGLLNGLAWALVTALLAFVWFGRSDLALVMGLAMVVNLLLAAASGIGVPLMMRRLSIDPALAGHVVLTTVTDVAGFFAFLGLGSLLLR